MDKEFVPYQESLELKELGFDKPCFGYYPNCDVLIQRNVIKNNFKTYTIAPIFSQAFRWFRENYGLVIQYIPFELDNEEGQSILHHKHKISEYDSWRGGRRNTIETELCDDYEEAELVCLKKLIEIVKEK